MARTGWLKLWRQMKDNPLWKEKPFSRGQAWIDLLIRANFSDTRIPHPGKIANVMLGPGEAIVSLSGLELDWGWSRNKLLRFLRYLKNETMIETTNETAFTRLKVLNWKKYQGDEDDDGTGGGTSDGTGEKRQTEPATEPPTEPVTEPATEPIRRIQEDKKEKKGEDPEPRAASTPPPPPPRFEDGGPRKDSAGNQTTATAPLSKDPRVIAASYREKDPRVPEAKAVHHIQVAIEMGANAEELHEAVLKNRERMKLWTICDYVVDRKKVHGKPSTRENAPTEKAAVLTRSSTAMDLARIEVDTKLAELPPEEVAAWRREAEDQAAAGKVPAALRATYVESAVRRRVAEKFGIKGV